MISTAAIDDVLDQLEALEVHPGYVTLADDGSPQPATPATMARVRTGILLAHIDALQARLDRLGEVRL